MSIKLSLSLVVLLLSTSLFAKNPPSAVSQVNLQQYVGKWYEIASFPNFFQRGCQCSMAYYTLLNGKVSVTNQCYKNNQRKQAKATAWAVPGSGNSKLKVQFFWPFKDDYWILYVSPNYQQAIVGSPNRKYLWILARTTQIKDSEYHKLIQVAKNKGFDIKKLAMTKQNCKKTNYISRSFWYERYSISRLSKQLW